MSSVDTVALRCRYHFGLAVKRMIDSKEIFFNFTPLLTLQLYWDLLIGALGLKVLDLLTTLLPLLWF
jgi:hypothetical protein